MVAQFQIFRHSALCGRIAAAAPLCPSPVQPCAAAAAGSRAGAVPPPLHRPARSLLALQAAAQEQESEQSSEDAALESRRQGYRSFQLEGCEFLVAETPDGLLDLSDAFMRAGSGEFQRAPSSGDLPAGPRPYQEAEWAASWGGNVFEGKEAKRWVHKVYLIPLASVDPYQLDFSQAFCVDGDARRLARCEVLRLAPDDADVADLRLRIREGVVTVDTIQSLPDVETVSRAARAGTAAVSELELERAEAEGLAVEALLRGTPDAGGAEGAEDDEGGAAEEAQRAEADVLYDDDTLRDFLVEVDDESEEFDYDMPGSDY